MLQGEGTLLPPASNSVRVAKRRNRQSSPLSIFGIVCPGHEARGGSCLRFNSTRPANDKR